MSREVRLGLGPNLGQFTLLVVRSAVGLVAGLTAASGLLVA